MDYLITSYLYSVYPSLKPGHLTDLRSACVNNTSFADVAGKWSFHKFIICDSSVLHEAIAKYINIGKSGTGKDLIEEKSCPKVVIFYSIHRIFYAHACVRKSTFSFMHDYHYSSILLFLSYISVVVSS